NNEQWGQKEQLVDFYDMKGDIEALLDLTTEKDQFQFVAGTHPALHPGQSADIIKAGEIVGRVGRLHPKVLQNLGLKDDTYVFELNQDAISKANLPAYAPLSKYPSIRRDLAIVVNDEVSCQQVLDVIKQTEAEIIKEVRIFDVYKGKGVDSGRKSIALGLILQESSRTLTDQDVESATVKVVGELDNKLGATLRD
ncbi:MAG: phenylalanine--tRNA ligase subunit beta, partial [Gammaproteobacteria bacterium]|nr:phenylalanine--tRNA ligase subunit beta [Gammaproteobacteria bacterium]